MKYGQNTEKIERFIAQIKNLTPEQIKAADDAAYAADDDDAAYAAYAAYAAAAAAAAYAAYAAAAYAAYAAYDDAADDADDAADDADDADNSWYFRWYFGRAAFALAIEHLIGKYGFTAEHFALLTKAVDLLNGFEAESQQG